jgi:NAD(P)-dependent dehydrogenase (short-subunit alcohol dehydrogenase family)
MTILVTGAAGFIGFHLCQALLRRGQTVVGIDNLNSYYDPALKQGRLERLLPQGNFEFVRLDLADREGMADLFARVRPRRGCGIPWRIRWPMWIVIWWGLPRCWRAVVTRGWSIWSMGRRARCMGRIGNFYGSRAC